MFDMPQVTPNKGIRYPLLNEAVDPNVIANTIFDLDTITTAEDALRNSAVQRRGALITVSSSPSVAKSTTTKFTFDTVMIDPNGLTNLGVNNDRFTIIKAGLYLFGASTFIASIGAPAVTSWELTIARNTTGAPSAPNIRRRKYPATGTGGGNYGSVAAPYIMAATDFVTLQTFWSGGGAGPATYTPPVFWVLPIALS